MMRAHLRNRTYATYCDEDGLEMNLDFLSSTEQQELDSLIAAYDKERQQAMKALKDYQKQAVEAAQEKLKIILAHDKQDYTKDEVKAVIELATGIVMDIEKPVDSDKLLGIVLPKEIKSAQVLTPGPSLNPYEEIRKKLDIVIEQTRPKD